MQSRRFVAVPRSFFSRRRSAARAPRRPPHSTRRLLLRKRLKIRAPLGCHRTRGAARRVRPIAGSRKATASARTHRDVGDLLWPSWLAARTRPLGADVRRSASQDIGDIAVIEDDGTLILQPNAFDLARRRPALRAQRRRVRRGAGRRHLPPVARARALAWRRRRRPPRRCRSRSRSTAAVLGAVRQLRRQPHLRGGRHGLHGARVRAAPRRAAARRAVLRRPRPVSGRARVRRCGCRRVHRDVVRRARIRVAAIDDGAGGAAAAGQRRHPLRWRVHPRRGARRAFPRTDRHVHAGRSRSGGPPGRWRRSGRRTLRRGPRARPGAGLAAFLRDASRRLRSARVLDGHGGRRPDAFAFESTVQNAIRGIGAGTFDASRRVWQRRGAPEHRGHGSRGEVRRRPGGEDPWREQHPRGPRARDGAPLARATALQ